MNSTISRFISSNHEWKFSSRLSPSKIDQIFSLLPQDQIEQQKTLYNNYFSEEIFSSSIHSFFSNIKSSNCVEKIKLIFPIISSFLLKSRDKNNLLTCWQLLFRKINKFSLQILKILLPFLMFDDFLYQNDETTTKSPHISPSHLGPSSTHCIRSLATHRIQCSNSKVKDACRPIPVEIQEDAVKSHSYWHYFLSNINTSSHFETVLVLLPYLDKENLRKKDNISGNTCWHNLLFNVNNRYKHDAFLLLLPFLDKKDLQVKNFAGLTCLDSFFRLKNEENFYFLEVQALLDQFLIENYRN